jgi:hypothetical protein
MFFSYTKKYIGGGLGFFNYFYIKDFKSFSWQEKI